MFHFPITKDPKYIRGQTLIEETAVPILQGTPQDVQTIALACHGDHDPALQRGTFLLSPF